MLGVGHREWPQDVVAALDGGQVLKPAGLVRRHPRAADRRLVGAESGLGVAAEATLECELVERPLRGEVGVGVEPGLGWIPSCTASIA